MKKIGNKIRLFKSKNDQIKTLQVTVVPKVSLYPVKIAYNYLYSAEYVIKNKETNTFAITIPDLIYKYFSYERYEGDYIKIISIDSLNWNDEIFR